MARWCVSTGLPPSEWKALRRDERDAIAEAHNQAIYDARAQMRT